MILVSGSPHPDGMRYRLKPGAYSETMRAVCREVPGMVWEPMTKSWVGYDDACALVVAKLRAQKIAKVIGEPLPFDDERGKKLVFDMPPSTKLRDYQKVGIDFLVRGSKAGCVLGDDTGVGKTIQALLALRQIGGKTLIVCPSIVKTVWPKEAKKWLGADVLVLEGATAPTIDPPEGAYSAVSFKNDEVVRDAPIYIEYEDPFAEHDIVVVNYDILHAWAAALTKSIDNLVFDECHALMNEKSRRSLAAHALRGRASRCVGLTATLITSRTRDLHNVINTISPGRLGKFYQFGMRYCDGHKEEVAPDIVAWNWNGCSNEEELNIRVRYFMLRRTKADVKLEVPPMTRETIEINVPTQSVVQYSSENDNGGFRRMLRKALSRSAQQKIDFAADLAADRMRKGSKIVLFVFEKKVAASIAAAIGKKGFENVYIATGDLTVKKRLELVALASREPSVLVCTMDSMTTGIDLSYADGIIFAELDYVPSKMLQCEGRVYRFGQKNMVLIQYVVALGTVDEYIRDIVLTKMETYAKVIGKTGSGLEDDLTGSQDEDAALARLREAIAKGA